ncbi:MAG: leucine--tRNA ligase, partial [Cyclobacteriaceae bacterium]|nr:leucine--tRNA ligase [Cyclobacteriaceae bacterium]
MAEYSKEEISRIEDKWRAWWKEKQVYKTELDTTKPKYYVLDMFPYPSGAGLHVGHPLGYIASDIVARYKRIKGFNVLHPMGFDAFGLPAEQYAIEHGIHPAVSTQQNIENFKKQLGRIGFCYDWSREVQTCDPAYYRWTQWIFLQIFDSWYNRKKEKAERIDVLVGIFAAEGNAGHPFPNMKYKTPEGKEFFSAREWATYDEHTRRDILMNYRLAYLAYTDVNWCEALGTVLANDEVINGVSYRGGFPVVKRQMRQWSLRITEYAERLLSGLDQIDFSDSMKDIQRNWIGKSVGCMIDFGLTPNPSPKERGRETASKKYWPILKANAKNHRSNPTPEEAILWDELRNNKLGYKIRRQHAIGTFIVDFVCLEKMLVIEVDGEYHEQTKEYDEARTEFLADEGFSLIRFKNHEVNTNLPHVLASIKSSLDKISIPKKTSLSSGEGWGEAGDKVLTVFTTRPDTIFGVDFMVLAPEHPLVKQVTTPSQQKEIDTYLKYVESRSEVDRMAEVKKVTGCFTGAYAINPLSQKEIPIWISEYVLAGYGTGAIMAVPCGDDRDHKFAKHFNLPITNIIGSHYDGNEANPTYDATLVNSGEFNGLVMREAMKAIIAKLEAQGAGKRQINYKMRDAGWSRQRYWGEPFPIVFKGEDPYAMDVKDLPLTLPDSDNFKPSGNGEGPLANLHDWINFSAGQKRDSNTMPTHAGAAWYFLRYMDPHNSKEFAGKKQLDYWNQVDVYIGGSEHAVAHLLYSRLWVKILHDLGYLNFDEPFKKLINQGKITGDSRFVYRVRGTNKFVSVGLIDKFETDPLHVDVNIVNGLELDVDAFRKSRPDYRDAEFVLEDNKYLCGSAIEKMSKSKYNVVNPDDIIDKYGADTLRMYEMFLGPLEASKPWSTNGIDGVYKFLRRFWNLFHDSAGKLAVSTEAPSVDELRVLHKTLKKVASDIEHYSFNTSVSEFMICVNELSSLKCSKRSVLEPLVIALSPFAPHIAEELWSLLGHKDTILNAAYPAYDEQYLKVNSHAYPISINGKVRATME